MELQLLFCDHEDICLRTKSNIFRMTEQKNKTKSWFLNILLSYQIGSEAACLQTFLLSILRLFSGFEVLFINFSAT